MHCSRPMLELLGLAVEAYDFEIMKNDEEEDMAERGQREEDGEIDGWMEDEE